MLDEMYDAFAPALKGSEDVLNFFLEAATGGVQ